MNGIIYGMHKHIIRHDLHQICMFICRRSDEEVQTVGLHQT